MKKQLIALSALFVVVSATQCSFYDRMKASAAQKYEQAKSGFAKVKASSEQYLPAAREMISSNLPAIKEATKEPVAKYLDQAMKVAASMARDAGVPESVIDKGKDVVKQGYVDQFGTAPKDMGDTTQATTGGAAGALPMTEEDRLYMESLRN